MPGCLKANCPFQLLKTVNPDLGEFWDQIYQFFETKRNIYLVKSVI